MRASYERFDGGAVRERGLYVVPRREIRLVRHVPEGRTLHMVDVENLVGGANISCVELAEAVRGYRESAPVSRGDHVIVGVGPTLLIAAGLAWPHARIVLGRGPSGADHALLASVPDAQWVAARFDRVILGSGDGIFVGLLVSLRRLGIAVGVVAATGSISWQLRRHAHFVRTVGCKRHSLGAA